jgi:uncharacterized membrane protein SpoIIM required for sporulation
MPSLIAVLHQLRYHILFAAALFLGSAVLGTLLTALPEALMQPLVALARHLQDKPWGPLTVFLLCKNALAALVAMLGGFLLGLPPFFAALTNGLVLGRVIALQPTAIGLLLPHGLFEITAVTIAWGTGFWCAGWLRRPPRGKRLRQRAAISLQLFFKVILPLLAVAAAIEAAGIRWLTAA